MAHVFVTGCLWLSKVVILNPVSGEVFTMGVNCRGQLGCKETLRECDFNREVAILAKPEDSFIESFIKVPIPVKIISVANLLECSIGIGEDGSVWSWGFRSDVRFALDIDIDASNITLPHQMSNLSGFIEISPGKREEISLRCNVPLAEAWGLDNNGFVWKFRNHTHPRDLTATQLKEFPPPVKVENIPPMHTIARSFGLDKQGCVWDMNTGSKIEDLKNIKQIDAGVFHLLAIDSNNQVWSFGGFDFSSYVPQSIASWEADFNDKPKLLSQFPKSSVSRIWCGDTSSFIQDVSGRVWVFGSNLAGQLAMGNENPYKEFTENPALLGVREIYPGMDCCLFLFADGSLHSSGALNKVDLSSNSNSLQLIANFNMPLLSSPIKSAKEHESL